MKLKGKKKAAFLAKMAAGRTRARRGSAALRSRKNPGREIVITRSMRDAHHRALESALQRARDVFARRGSMNEKSKALREAFAAIEAPLERRKRNPSGKRKGRKRKRKNPQLLTITNPSSTLSKARALSAYKRFHGVNPPRIARIGAGTGYLISLGALKEIVYQPRVGDRKGPAFFHKFKAGNQLAVTPDGRQLFVVDKRKRTAVRFDRGIVS